MSNTHSVVNIARRLHLRASLFVFLAIVALLPSPIFAKVTIFWQEGFPTVASDPIPQAVLGQALDGMDPQFVDLAGIDNAGVLTNSELLVLPYGSAVPVEAWQVIDHYLQDGGNLLILGGQALRVPVMKSGSGFEEGRAQDTYSRVLDFRHTYEVPVPAGAHFEWKHGDDFTMTRINARRYFAIEGRLDGLGYMVDSTGSLVAAPVIVTNHVSGPMQGARIVALDFDPAPGYWDSKDGVSLIRTAADYARRGATEFSTEVEFSTIRLLEPPQITVHLRDLREERYGGSTADEVSLSLRSGQQVVSTATLPLRTSSGIADMVAPLHDKLQPGFYTVSAVLREHGQFREFYQNGFWVEDPEALNSGPVLGVKGDFLTLDGATFLPVGTNYFTTEENGWDFSGPRNAWVWDKDFDEMSQHGVTFVRTGVWMSNGRFVEPNTGGVNERFLRNLEAFLLSAQRHHVAVNFTFFAFSPRSGTPSTRGEEVTAPNPYTDMNSVRAEQAYIRSIVEHFKNVPWLSYDLINEPSFSNPRHVFKGNYPNGDPTEVAAWRHWLRQKYRDNLEAVADAWAIPAGQLGSFEIIPLPTISDITYERYRNSQEVRALDYGLFAQDMFSDWVKSMVKLIRGSGSKQLIDVGQDEGGVTDRLLNQFYGGSGVSFTTNHTYWQDDALLWDSFAAKRVGVPNITGETGYQPAWAPDGTWRYDELTGLGLIERKWALGFAAGSSGAVQWDWAREVDFGMKRSDGSAKAWENMMRNLGEFAVSAAPLATALKLPDVAIVLPQSFQLSTGNLFALEAQQTAIRALYGYARSEAYAVGEYQIDLLGSPKLILLPSPFGMTQASWEAIEEKVKAGAVLLVTGPAEDDAHLHATDRLEDLGIKSATEPLTIREAEEHYPWGDEQLSFGANKTTVLSRAQFAGNQNWVEKQTGKGKILFSALPLELNDNLKAVGDAYVYALKVAGVTPSYTTTLTDPGIMICPTHYPDATLYVLTSESNQTHVALTDVRSGRSFEGEITPGRAAILLVDSNGRVRSAYNWSVPATR